MDIAILKSLFTARTPIPSAPNHRDFADELNDVKTGKKALARYSGEASDHRFRSQIARAARKQGLALLIEQRPLDTGSRVIAYENYFIGHPADMWRVEALSIVGRAIESWGHSEGLEHVESALLGYSKQQTIDWIKDHRKEQPSWPVIPVYFLVPQHDYRNLNNYGYRCVTSEILSRAQFFVNLGGDSPRIKEEALPLLPSNLILCRLGLRSVLFVHLVVSKIPDAKASVYVITIDEEELAAWNGAMGSNIERYLNGEWVYEGFIQSNEKVTGPSA